MLHATTPAGQQGQKTIVTPPDSNINDAGEDTITGSAAQNNATTTNNAVNQLAIVPGQEPRTTTNNSADPPQWQEKTHTKLIKIQEALVGTEYNTQAAREAIFVTALTGFSQLHANARIIAEMAGCSKEGHVLKGKQVSPRDITAAYQRG